MRRETLFVLLAWKRTPAAKTAQNTSKGVGHVATGDRTPGGVKCREKRPVNKKKMCPASEVGTLSKEIWGKAGGGKYKRPLKTSDDGKESLFFIADSAEKSLIDAPAGDKGTYREFDARARQLRGEKKGKDPTLGLTLL